MGNCEFADPDSSLNLMTGFNLIIVRGKNNKMQVWSMDPITKSSAECRYFAVVRGGTL